MHVGHSKLWKILKRGGNTRIPYLPPEKSMQVKKLQLQPDLKQQIGSKLGKEYVTAVYCHLLI